ncbi:MAG: hypothetical protein WBZ48_01940 [Bacteroidota bacterium]
MNSNLHVTPAFVATALLLSGNVSRAQSDVDSVNGLKERANTFAVYGGMGVSLATAPGLVNYLNTLADPSQQISGFGTNIEFFGGTEFPLSIDWGGALEYSYFFKSYTIPTSFAGTYSIFYNINMPTAMVHYVMSGKGYFLKFGGGIGYHTASLEQKWSYYGTDSTYSTHGIGLKAQAVGETAFDDHLYGYISGNMRWELLGELKNNNGTVLQNQGKIASLSMFVVGLSFGVIYYF